MYRYLVVLSFLAPFIPLSSPAQDITGIWRGYFITEGFDQYKFELQVKQTGSTVSGVSYSYLSTVFYGKATLTGNFNKTGQSALIREIKTVELKMSGGSQACIMKCVFRYERSGKEEFLEGTFTSKFEKDGFMNKKGDNCGGGKVYLRKVTTSDFYIEPFLRGKIKTVPVIVNKAPVKKDTAKAKPTTPPVKKPVTTVKPPVTKITKPVTKPVIKPENKPVTKTTPPGDKDQDRYGRKKRSPGNKNESTGYNPRCFEEPFQ
jgi:Periplasmic protein TonB, links inner and outer membranes